MEVINMDLLKHRKKEFDILGFNYVTTKDRKIIDYVVKNLYLVNPGVYHIKESFTLDKVKALSVECLDKVGIKQTSKVISLLGSVGVEQVYNDFFMYSCNILFDGDDVTKVIDKDSGYVKNYRLPYDLDITSPVFLAHEHIHALKDTNYNEYINSQVHGDTINILFELISSEEYEGVLRFRMICLYNLLKEYSIISRLINDKKDGELYKAAFASCAQYFNSFYYALILYNMYKNNPVLIMEYVNKVLNHEMTTKEALEALNILHVQRDKRFDEEFRIIKRKFK